MGPEVKFEYPIEDTPTFTAKQIRDARPSPDGTRLAFTALDRLYVMDLPDGTPERLTNEDVGEYHPTWSPDGASIAYVTWDDDDGHIKSVRSTGGSPRQLTTASAYYQQTAWSADGERIVAIRSDARNLQESIDPFVFSGLGPEFVWVPANGGETTVIGPTGGRGGPHFTQSDPDRIYSYGIAPAADGQPRTVALVSTRWDNTDLKRHLRVTWRIPVFSGAYEISPTSDLVMPRDFSKEETESREIIPQASAGFVMMAPQGDAGRHHFQTRMTGRPSTSHRPLGCNSHSLFSPLIRRLSGHWSCRQAHHAGGDDRHPSGEASSRSVLVLPLTQCRYFGRGCAKNTPQ